MQMTEDITFLAAILVSKPHIKQPSTRSKLLRTHATIVQPGAFFFVILVNKHHIRQLSPLLCLKMKQRVVCCFVFGTQMAREFKRCPLLCLWHADGAVEMIES